MFTRPLILNHGIRFPPLPAVPVETLRADDLYPLVARMSSATLTSTDMVSSMAGKSLVVHHSVLWLLFTWMISFSRVPFSASSSTCWVMVIQNPPKKIPKRHINCKEHVKLGWGLKSPVCSESMHVLARLLIVQPHHTYANSLSWSQSIERLTASIWQTKKKSYTGPYNHWIELRASVSVLFPSPMPDQRKKARSNVLLYRCFRIIFKDLFLLKLPPSETVIGHSFLVNIW